MSRSPIRLAIAAPIALLLVSGPALLGRSSGTIPGAHGIPANATTALPSCGSCHGSGRPGDRGPVSSRFTGIASVPKSTDVSFTFEISSRVAGTRGGFAVTTDKGVFKPIGNTQVGLAGRAISHTNNATRKWSFRFRSDQTGLANWHAVGNTVNGDFRDKDDSWGFYGPNPSLPGAAFHVFVNDDQVFPYGKSCAGSHGYTPLIGAATNARRGQTFPVELYDVPPQTAAIGIFGFSNKSFGAFQLPLSLAPFGAPGCDLNASMELLMPVPTTGSGNGGGKAVFNWVIPNIPALRGQNIYLSALVADAGANRLGIASGMGLRAVIQ